MNPTTAIPTQGQAKPNIDYSQFGNYSDSARQAIQSGASLQDVQNAYQKVQQQAQPQQSQQKQPAWWERLLPTAGSVLGGLGGALIPGLGETGVGEVAGYGFGQAAGQGLENLLTRKPWSQNVVKQGIEGAAFGGAGKVLGGVTEALGGSLLNKGTSMLENLSSSQTQAAEKLANVNKQAASELNYKGIGETLADKYKLGKNQQFVDNLGFASHNPYDMQKVAQGGYELNKVYDNALQTGTADMSKFSNDTYSALKNSGVQDLNSSPVGRALSDYGINVRDSLPKDMPLTEVRKLQQSIGKEMSNQENIINNAELNGSYNQEAVANHSSLEKIYNDLGTKIKTPEVNKAVDNYKLTNEQQAAMKADQPITLQDGTKFGGYGETHGQYLIDTINNAKNADDLLKPMQSYTQMGKASEKAINDIENVTNSSRATARATASAEGNPGVALPDQPPEENLLQHAINAVKVAASGGGKISKAMQLADIAAKTKIAPKALEKTGSILTRIGKVTIPKAKPFESGALPSVSPLGMAAAGTGALLTTPPPVAGQQQGGAMQGAQTAQPNANLEAFNQLMNQAQGTLGTSSSPALIQALSALAPIVSKQQEAAPLIQSLQQSYQNAGGAQGPLQGLITKISGLLPGSAASAYQQQQESTSSALSNILGLNPAQSQQLRGLMPSLMSNQQTAQPQITALQNLTGQFGAPTIGQ